MIYNVYCVRDVVADDTICMFYAATDGVAIRDNLPALSHVRPVDDLRLYRVGTFDSKHRILVPEDSLLVDWGCYKFPEMPGTPAKLPGTPAMPGTPAKLPGTPAMPGTSDGNKVDNFVK